MDLFGKFRKLDTSLQRGLDNGFARVFGGEVVPAEIDELLKQQVEDSVMVDSHDRQLAPNQFVVQVAERDGESLHTKHPNLERDLSNQLSRFIRNSGWATNGAVQVRVVADSHLHSGQLRADARFDSDSPREVTARDYDAGLANIVIPPDNARLASSAAQERSNAPAEAPNPPAEAPSAPPEDASAPAAGSNTPAEGANARAEGSNTPDNESNGSADAAASSPSPSDPAGNDAGGNTPHGAIDAELSDSPADGVSYPGTTVITHAAHEETPIRGGTGEPNPNELHMTVTLLLRDGSDRRYQLRQGSNLIGRGNTVDLRIPDTGVSRQHADIVWDGYDAVLTDLHSTNGTTVNDTPIENWLLADGDIIVMGHSEIEVCFDTTAVTADD